MIILTSQIDKDKRVLKTIKENLQDDKMFLFIASDRENLKGNIEYMNKIKNFLNQEVKFEKNYILDNRFIEYKDELIENASLIFLAGGHLPSSNKFYNDINLKESLKNFKGILTGESAGSMNMANIVYAPPEYDYERIDPNYEKYLKGLDLCNINIFPHLNWYINDKGLMDIVIKDSNDIDIIGLLDGSYITIDNDIKIHGESYLFRKEKIYKITNNK